MCIWWIERKWPPKGSVTIGGVAVLEEVSLWGWAWRSLLLRLPSVWVSVDFRWQQDVDLSAISPAPHLPAVCHAPAMRMMNRTFGMVSESYQLNVFFIRAVMVSLLSHENPKTVCLCTDMQLCVSKWWEYVFRNVLLGTFAFVWLSQDKLTQTDDIASVYLGCVAYIIDFEIQSVVDLNAIIQCVTIHTYKSIICIILLKNLGLHILFVYKYFACMYISVLCMFLVPNESGRGYRIPWTRSYRWL